MLRPHRTLLVTVFAAVTVASSSAIAELAAPAAEAAHTATVALLSCTGSKLTRPRGTVVLACGDGNIEITATDWSSWTSSSASGKTTLDVNLCHPNCVQSKMSSFADSSVLLSGVRHTATGAVFSRATITYSHAGRTATVTAYPRT